MRIAAKALFLTVASVAQSFVFIHDSNAALARLTFSATIIGPLIGGTDGIGVEIHGSYILETTTPDIDPSPSYGEYRFAVVEGAVTVGSEMYVAETQSGFTTVYVNNNVSGGDLFALRSGIDRNTDGALLEFTLFDTTSSAFASQAFPEEPFDLADFDGYVDTTGLNTAVYILGLQTYGSVIAEIDSASYQIVPIPTAALFLFSGIVAICCVKRRAA